MEDLGGAIARRAAETGFSGVVRVDRGGEVVLQAAHGLGDRAHGVPNADDTQFGIASGTKGLTAATVLSLVEDGALGLSTTARSLLGDDLPLIAEDVTVGHLLAHRSGIGDYLDESLGRPVTDHVLGVPVHTLDATERYLAVLDGHPTAFAPGERFAYNNSGYVVLALLAERAAGVPFPDLVDRRVCAPAGMRDTAFLRSDELPGRAAVGYLESGGSLRSNVLHLPVRGSGDGGCYSTAADVAAFWRALLCGAILPERRVAEMMRPRSRAAGSSMRYGLGLWLHPSRAVAVLEGCDAGVSFRSVHDPVSALTHTVMSNTTDGAWPVTRLLDELLGL
jgi:CubicO group peptidase (beta-lactamase class C family)